MPADALTQPATLSQYILKVHSRCNLACDHCYVYEHPDQGWREQPLFMRPETIRRSAQRIAEHAEAHRLGRVRVVLHGGEPLLIGAARLADLLAVLAAEIAPVTALDLRMQTNGVLLSAEICEILARYAVKVGVSLDGDLAANDVHRRYIGGASSHQDVVRALDLLRGEYAQIYAGILCTVDLRNDPIRVYEALAAHHPPRVDFLLPHGNWDNPPPNDDGRYAPYGTWLGRVFDRWEADGRPMDVRLFSSLRSTAAGGPSTSEWVGLSRADLVVIETNGAWEQADSLKSAYHGAPRTGMSVFTHSVDQVAATEGIARRQTGIAGLSATCRACRVVHQCGGGLFAHRYREANEFDNPSVYCDDLKELIGIVNNHVPVTRQAPDPAPGETRAGLPAGVLAQLATGHGSESSVQVLADTHLEDTRSLLAAIGRDHVEGLAALGWNALTEMDQSEATRDALTSVLRHAYLQRWAVDVLRGAADPGYLACVAAAAAIRSGAERRIEVPVHHGAIHLPTHGSVSVPGAETATVTTSAAGFTIRAGDRTIAVPGDTDAWRASRVVSDGSPRLAIEDLDPHRACHRWPVRDRLDDEAARDWSAALVNAWDIIARDAPHRIPGLNAGLTSVTPLRDGAAGQRLSASTRYVFGAVAISRTDPVSMAVLMVHEFQHVQLNEVLAQCDLFDPDYRPLLSVGWRDEPRPIEMVFHGAYAHAAVAEMWGARARRDAPNARALFDRYRAQTAQALDRLAATNALTPAGEAFVTGLATTVARWSP